MTFLEMIQEGVRQLAESQSEGEGIDKHWEAILPDMEGILVNETFLVLNARVFDQSMERQAAQIAKDLPLPNVSTMSDAELYLRVLISEAWVGLAESPEFQDYVSANIDEAIHVTPSAAPNQQCIGWAKFSRLWLPFTEDKYVQIVKALADRFRQYRLAECCWDELRRRHVVKKASKYMWALLHPESEVITEENRVEAYNWLEEISSKVTKGIIGIDSSDVGHNWLVKLLAQHTHVQLQKIRATSKAIRQDAITAQCEEHLHDSLEKKELPNIIANESPGNPDLITDNPWQNLEAKQAEIEAILDCDPKITKRRFQVLQIISTWGSDRRITDTAIATQLKVSKQTIGRDKCVIREKFQQIRNVIES